LAVPRQLDQERKEWTLTADLERTTAAILAADQAHLASVHDETIWARQGFLGHLIRGERRAAGWRRLFARGSLA
jgi:hypothetical protein